MVMMNNLLFSTSLLTFQVLLLVIALEGLLSQFFALSLETIPFRD